MKPIASLLLPAFIAAGCATTTSDPESGPESGPETAPAQSLSTLVDLEWFQRLEDYPQLATRFGVTPTRPLTDMSLPALEHRAARNLELFASLNDIPREGLDREQQINYDVMHRILSDRADYFKFHEYLVPMTVDSGFHIALARLPNGQALKTESDYARYLEQLRAIPEYMDQHIALLKMGMDQGVTLPRIVLDGYEVTIHTHVVEDADESLFFVPFTRIPESISETSRKHLESLGREEVMDSVVPAYQALLSFMMDTYIPNARTTIGASDLPGGKAHYEALVRQFTTLDLTPPVIHEIGLKEVARIREEMVRVINRLEFEGSFQEFIHFLRTDEAFYAKTPDELLNQAMVITKRMDGALPAMFGKLPRMTYTVAPVPDHLAPKYTGGRYVPTSAGSTRPGYYWVNTYALESRPLYVLEALSLHEAVPGHHLQMALSQELDHLPKFRRELYLSAFGEGWGLYSEWLGKEAGFYQDPYSEFGRLTYEMWRACRLVVDTGIHAFGWTRKQAMDFLAENTALSLHEVRTETDRYISWPGQAVSYKIGELEIKALRQMAEEKLGARFDVRAFHDAILKNGTVPLPVLREEIERYLEEATES